MVDSIPVEWDDVCLAEFVPYTSHPWKKYSQERKYYFCHVTMSATDRVFAEHNLPITPNANARLQDDVYGRRLSSKPLGDLANVVSRYYNNDIGASGFIYYTFSSRRVSRRK